MKNSDSGTHTQAFFTDSFDTPKFDEWRQMAEKSVSGGNLDSLTKKTASGLTFAALYTDRPSTNDQLPAPQLQRWDNRLAVISDTPENQNAAILAGLQGGISSVQLSVACPEHPSAIPLENFDHILQDVQLEILPISLKAGSKTQVAAEQLEAIWNSRNVKADEAQGSLNADPIGTFAQALSQQAGANPADNTQSITSERNANQNIETRKNDIQQAIDDNIVAMCQIAQRCNERFAKVKAIGVDSTCYHNAGASIEQELVASIATAATYMQAMIDSGMTIQAAHDNLVFHLACDADWLANVIKLRTLKMLWHHTAHQFGVVEPTLNLVVETSLRMQSTLEPWVNHLRNISSASAAAMGGAQSIIVHPHNRIDGAYVDNDVDISARVARNIAIILSEETRMNFINDPMAGSYAVETQSDELSQTVWHGLQTLEHSGGLVQQLVTGEWQNNIAHVQQERVARLRDEQDIKIGVNRYTTKQQQNSSSSVSQMKPDEVNKAQTSAISETAEIDKKTSSLVTGIVALKPVRDAMEFEVLS